VDWLQILLYTAAYITTTLATPLDDQLYYEVRCWLNSCAPKVPRWLNSCTFRDEPLAG